MEAVAVYSAPNTLIDMTIPLAHIRPSGFNPRKRFDAESLQELADSIREHGLLEPIVVRPIAGALLIKGDTYLYEIVAGERRYRACKIAGLQKIPARVADGLSDTAALKLAIIENVQRVDLDPLEEAEGYRQLARLGMRQREIAESVNRSQPAVANAMRLLELPESVQAKIRAGDLSASHGIALASYRVNRHVQEGLAEIAVREKWPTKKLEGYFGDAQSYYLVPELKEYVYEIRGGEGWNWKAECQGQCPHDAFRASSQDWRAWCLRPACFEEKRRDAKRAQEEANARKIQEAVATTGAAVINARDLGFDGTDYRTIYLGTKLPDGCEPGCPKRVKALDGGGQLREICSDVKCWKRLEMAATKAKNKAGRNRAKAMIGEIDRAIDGLQVFGAREMAVIAALALSQHEYRGKILDEACERQGVPELRLPLGGHRHDATGKAFAWNRYQLLSEYSLVDLARVILDVAMRRESENLAQNPGWGDATPITNWYLGIQEEQAAAPADEPADDGLGSTILVCRECGRTDEDEDYEGDWEEDTLCSACAQESGEADGDG